MIMRFLASAAGALFLIGPVFADTRDEVVQGILRCAAIKHDRTWLDCTYGAQQPCGHGWGCLLRRIFNSGLCRRPPQTDLSSAGAACCSRVMGLGLENCVRPAVLGSFNLQVNNGPVFKVERRK
jgi:hypothetical protein